MPLDPYYSTENGWITDCYSRNRFSMFTLLEQIIKKKKNCLAKSKYLFKFFY